MWWKLNEENPFNFLHAEQNNSTSLSAQNYLGSRPYKVYNLAKGDDFN